MAGGINIAPGIIASVGGIAYAAKRASEEQREINLASENSGPYRPSSWTKPALTMITVPAAYAPQATVSDASYAGDGGGPDGNSAIFTMSATGNLNTSKPQSYVFDAVFSLQHSQSITLTKNPIQTGSSVADHAYLNPARLTMAIGMSDAQDGYAKGMWVGASTKSTSAFYTLTNLRDQRIPLMVSTRLKTYSNMMILDVRASDSLKTLYGLAAVIEFEQIFIADVATSTPGASARTQTTDTTNQGTVGATEVPAGVSAQNQLPSDYTNVPDSATIQAAIGTVQGAGNWSSNNTAGLAELIAQALAT